MSIIWILWLKKENIIENNKITKKRAKKKRILRFLFLPEPIKFYCNSREPLRMILSFIYKNIENNNIKGWVSFI